MKLWDHQTRMIESARKRSRRENPICMVAPCGSGKTLVMLTMAMGAVEKGLRVAIFSCRIQNTKQLLDRASELGLDCGAVAAALKSRADHLAPVQICQMQTVSRRSGALPDVDLVLVDEAHQQATGGAKKILDCYRKAGKFIIGFTATPLGTNGCYSEMIEATDHDELVRAKAHLPCRTFVPESPLAVFNWDSSVMKVQSSGEISAEIDKMLNKVDSVYGNVLNEWRRLNPEQLPSVLFAPDVASAVGYVDKFRQSGIRCASIDGQRVVLCREDMSGLDEFDSTLDARQEVLDGSRDGTYKVVCNRFILREAVDMPWIFHGILTTTMTGLSSYLQSCGRVLRYWPQYDHVIIQDHGGSTDIHGLCFDKQDWELEDTNRSMAKKTKEARERSEDSSRQVKCKCGRLRRGGQKCEACGYEAPKDREPIVCPKCQATRIGGGKCYNCGHIHKRSVRKLRDTEGKLTEVRGRITKRKRPKDFDHYLRQTLWRFRNSQSGLGTINQAVAIAKKKARIAGIQCIDISKTGVNLPTDKLDWGRTVKDFYGKRRI